jgi:hypothetical protein
MILLPMIRRILCDERGSVIVENTLTMWVFVLFTLGIAQAGVIMWSTVGLQYGVEMAARCASVSDAAIATGFQPATTPTPCYSTNRPGAANNAQTVRAYASQNSWGVGVPSSDFRVATGSCVNSNSNSNTVSANYRKSFMKYLFSIRLRPQSCYPTSP